MQFFKNFRKKEIQQVPFNISDVCPITHIPIHELDDPVLLLSENRIYESKSLMEHIVYTLSQPESNRIYKTPVNRTELYFSPALMINLLNLRESPVMQIEEIGEAVQVFIGLNQRIIFVDPYEQFLEREQNLFQRMAMAFYFLEKIGEFLLPFIIGLRLLSICPSFLEALSSLFIIASVLSSSFGFCFRKYYEHQEISSENQIFRKITKEEIAEMSKNAQKAQEIAVEIPLQICYV